MFFNIYDIFKAFFIVFLYTLCYLVFTQRLSQQYRMVMVHIFIMLSVAYRYYTTRKYTSTLIPNELTHPLLLLLLLYTNTVTFPALSLFLNAAKYIKVHNQFFYIFLKRERCTVRDKTKVKATHQ